MRHEQKLTSIQIVGIILGGMFGIFSLAMPSSITKTAGNDAWLSVLLGGAVIIFMWFILIKLSLYYKEETVVEYLPKIYGRWIGNLLIALLLLYLIMTVSFLGRYFADLARLQLLPNTPRWAILLVFWIVIAYWAHFGIRVIAISMTIILIPTFLNVAGFLFIPLERIRLEHLLPVMGEGLLPILSGAYNSIFFYFGAASLFFIFPVIKEPQKVFKPVALAITTVSIVYSLLIVILIAKFSTNEVNNMIYPVVTLMKTLQIPGGFLERTDIVFFAVFIATSLDDAALYLYLSILGMVRWTKKNTTRAIYFLHLL